jgi:hypothetical protein
MRRPITTNPPADGGYPVDSDLHQMSDDGGPVGPDPARWADADWGDIPGEKDAVTQDVPGRQPDTVGLRTAVVLSPAVEARVEAEVARAEAIRRTSERSGRTAGGISWGPGTAHAE